MLWLRNLLRRLHRWLKRHGVKLALCNVVRRQLAHEAGRRTPVGNGKSRELDEDCRWHTNADEPAHAFRVSASVLFNIV